MESEKVDKVEAPEVKGALMEDKKENKEEEEVAEGDIREPIEWVDNEKACAQLRVRMPKIEKCGVELLWNMMEEVRKDPDGLDIEKLRFDALSSLDEITSSYEVAAGGSGVTMYSMVMKK